MSAPSRRQPAKTAPAPQRAEEQVPSEPAATQPTAPALTVHDKPRAIIPTADPAAGEQTVTVRPLTFADVVELTQRGGQIDVYKVEVKGGTTEPALVPAVLTTNDPLRENTPLGKPVYPVDERGRTDKTQPALGLSLGVTVRDMFGSETGGTLHTTQIAEGRAAAEFLSDRATLRQRLAVPAEEGAQMPLVPVYGSTVNVTAFVHGIDPDDALRVVQEALAEAFPEQANLTMRRIQARPVEDHRVNVFDTVTGETLAIDILAAEASYVAKRSGYRTETVPAGAVRGNR